MENIIREICVKWSIDFNEKEEKKIEKEIIRELYERDLENIEDFKKKKSNYQIKRFLGRYKLINDSKLKKEKIKKIREESNVLFEKLLEGIYKIEESTNFKNKIIFYFLSEKYKFINEIKNLLFKTDAELKFFLEDVSRAFNESNNEINDKEKITLLESEIQKLRSSLILLESEKSDFEEENEMLKSKYEMQALIDIFKKMNSEEYDYLLDNFLKNNKMLKILKKDGFVIPIEIESMVISQKVFMKFLKKNQIKEIEKIGKELELTVDESNAYNYSGSEFVGEEIKNVIIETSGWKIGGTVISQPKVKEVINDEQE